MNRRRLLSWLGTLGTSALAGCGWNRSPETPPTTPRGTEPTVNRPITPEFPAPPPETPSSIATEWGFDDIVDISEAGADQEGKEPIDDVLAETIRDNRLIFFPPGEYRLAETFTIGDSTTVALLGDDATIVPQSGFSDTLLGLGYPTPLSELYVRGLTFDFEANRTGGRPILAVAEDLVVVQDIAVKGVVDVLQDLFRIDVISPDGRGIVERLSFPDGATVDGVTGCEVGNRNHGDLWFVDCHIEGFPDNGLYADPPEGSVTVEGGFYRNNGVAGIRIQTSESGIVRGAHVVCDDADAAGENLRGIRLRAGESVLVEDCLVELLEVSSSDGAVTFASELESATVRNCHLHVDADGVNALRVKTPNDDATSATRSGPFRCENVTITGNAAGGAAVRASGRDECSFDNLCIHQSGADRDGIDATNVVGELVNSRLAVTGSTFRFSNSTFDRLNVEILDPTAGNPCNDRQSGKRFRLL